MMNKLLCQSHGDGYANSSLSTWTSSTRKCVRRVNDIEIFVGIKERNLPWGQLRAQIGPVGVKVNCIWHMAHETSYDENRRWYVRIKNYVKLTDLDSLLIFLGAFNW